MRRQESREEIEKEGRGVMEDGKKGDGGGGGRNDGGGWRKDCEGRKTERRGNCILARFLIL